MPGRINCVWLIETVKDGFFESMEVRVQASTVTEALQRFDDKFPGNLNKVNLVREV